jgi:hypothetical protein
LPAFPTPVKHWPNAGQILVKRRSNGGHPGQSDVLAAPGQRRPKAGRMSHLDLHLTYTWFTPDLHLTWQRRPKAGRMPAKHTGRTRLEKLAKHWSENTGRTQIERSSSTGQSTQVAGRTLAKHWSKHTGRTPGKRHLGVPNLDPGQTSVEYVGQTPVKRRSNSTWASQTLTAPSYPPLNSSLPPPSPSPPPTTAVARHRTPSRWPWKVHRHCRRSLYRLRPGRPSATCGGGSGVGGGGVTRGATGGQLHLICT